MDILYVVREGEFNEELRFSLRSLANIDHGQVWIAGYKPSWVTNVNYVPTRQLGTRFENSMRNLVTALDSRDLSEDVLLMNDDFFILKKHTSFPLLHRGPLQEHLNRYIISNSRYYQIGRETMRYLEDKVTDPLSYSLHCPMPFNKALMAKVIKDFFQSGGVECHTRTVYGNLAGQEGALSEDFKILKKDQFTGWKTWKSWPVASTYPPTFSRTPGLWIRSRFPQRSIYETSVSEG